MKNTPHEPQYNFKTSFSRCLKLLRESITEAASAAMVMRRAQMFSKVNLENWLVKAWDWVRLEHAVGRKPWGSLRAQQPDGI